MTIDASAAAERYLTVITYDIEGQVAQQLELAPAMEDAWLPELSVRLNRLSRDLELPLEIPVPGPPAQLTLRICASPSAAYTIYYWYDEPVMASLILAGQDESTESELQQTFKFLLLESEDEDEPDDETLEAIAAAAEYDFGAIESRPVLYQVSFLDEVPQDLDEERLRDRDRILAAAFLAASGVSPWDQQAASG